MQAQAKAIEKKAVEVAEEVAAAKAIVLSEYQSLVEIKQVYGENYDEGVHDFMYNVWHKHPEWDLSFLREVAREMVTEFNAPPETPLMILL